jgi:hypothetical protein
MGEHCIIAIRESQVCVCSGTVVGQFEYPHPRFSILPVASWVREKSGVGYRSKPADDFLKGVCSICPAVRFNVTGNSLEQKQLLRNMFDLHVRRAHAQEDKTTKVKP